METAFTISGRGTGNSITVGYVTPIIFVCYNSTQSNGKWFGITKIVQGTWAPKPAFFGVHFGVHKPWNSVIWRGKGLPQAERVDNEESQ